MAGRVLLRHHAASVVDAVLARRFGAHGSITRTCAWSRQDIALARRLHKRVAMKRSTRHKLALRPQTLRLLANDELDRVAGGAAERVVNGILMKDTIIIRTGG